MISKILLSILLFCPTSWGLISVAEFGALADDEIDDTRHIQEALDYGRDNGKPVIYFPKGVYLLGESLFDCENYGIASCLHVYSGQTLIFEKGAVLKRSNASVSHMLYSHNDEQAEGYGGCHDITIIGATIDENGSLNCNDTAFNFSHGDRINIIGCEFHGACCTWHSIEINSCQNVLVDKCVFRDNSNSEDIQLDAALGYGNLGKNDDTVCQKIIISNCLFRTDGHIAIGNHSDATHHDILIINNRFSGTGRDGEFISFVPSTHSVSLVDNQIEK